MSEYEHTEHLLIQIDYLRTANRQLREYAEDAVAKIQRLEEAGDAMDKTAEPFVLDTIDEDTPMSKVGEQYEIIYDSPPTAGDHVAMNRARKEWRKAKEDKP